MKTVKELFKEQPLLQNEPAVQELIAPYEKLCDDFIERGQMAEMSKEKPLKELIVQMLYAINDEIKKDEESVLFKEIPRVDFKAAVNNLETYIYTYLKDYNIRIN
jgi:hypothetical protein